MQPQASAQASLEELLAGFDRDGVRTRNRIRELVETDPQSFRNDALRLLKTPSSSRGVRYVVKLLVSNDFLFQALCDPAMSMPESLALARAAIKVEPLIDIAVAKQLAEAVGELTPETACRVLDVLDEISNGNRIMRSLMRLLQQTNPQIRTKAVLMVGRARRSVKWVQSRFAESDPRKRANSVEALWGIDTVEARDALRAGTRDGSNRVAGNALVALHRMGDPWMIQEVMKMATAEDWLFRASAAWVMGETGDPRFLGTLGNMMRDGNALVRRRTFAALGKIKNAMAQTRKGREWRLTASLLTAGGTVRRIRLEAAGEGGELPKITPTQFLLIEDGQPVTKYEVEERPAGDVLGVSFLFPRTADSRPAVVGALQCLPRKRPSDLWHTAFYVKSERAAETGGGLPTAMSGEGTPETASEPPSAAPSEAVPELIQERPLFTSNAEEAAAALEKPPGQTECPDFWKALRLSVEAAESAACGTRQLTIYCAGDPGDPADVSDIISAAIAARIAVYAIAATPNGSLDKLCQRTQGFFRLANQEADIGRLVEEAYQASLSRFLISYPPLTPDARSLQIRVFSNAGWGEANIEL